MMQKAQENFSQTTNQTNQNKANNPPKKKKEVVGEYIDFEEIKDEN